MQSPKAKTFVGDNILCRNHKTETGKECSVGLFMGITAINIVASIQVGDFCQVL